jgi:hypothetical protein
MRPVLMQLPERRLPAFDFTLARNNTSRATKPSPRTVFCHVTPNGTNACLPVGPFEHDAKTISVSKARAPYSRETPSTVGNHSSGNSAKRMADGTPGRRKSSFHFDTGPF